MKPYYILRTFGGLLFLLGSFVMVYNIYMTLLGRVRDETPIPGAVPTAQPAE